MAGSPDYKIYMGKDYIGCFKDVSHAEIFCEAMQQGDHIHGCNAIEFRDGHGAKAMIKRYPKLTKITVEDEEHWTAVEISADLESVEE